MDRQSEDDTGKQWKNWEKAKAKELKTEREKACLGGASILGGLSKEVSALERT